ERHGYARLVVPEPELYPVAGSADLAPCHDIVPVAPRLAPRVAPAKSVVGDRLLYPEFCGVVHHDGAGELERLDLRGLPEGHVKPEEPLLVERVAAVEILGSNPGLVGLSVVVVADAELE